MVEDIISASGSSLIKTTLPSSSAVKSTISTGEEEISIISSSFLFTKFAPMTKAIKTC